MKLFKFIVFIAASVGSLAYGVEFRRGMTFDDIHAASCRVSVPGARGSGTFVGYRDNEAYILTNYHVVTNNTQATLEFWSNSTLQRIPGRVIWRAYDVNTKKVKDFAFIVVDANQLKEEIDPPYIPLAGSNVRPSSPSFIVSSGAPDGRFTQAWKGKVVGYYNGETVEFQPPPVPGQSGSGIVTFLDGEPWVTAVLTWLFGQKGQDDSKGGAIPIANLYEAILSSPMPTSIEEDSDKTPSIPENATECAEKKPSLTALIFTAPDCLACKSAADDLGKLDDLISTKKINTKTKTGYTAATAYFVSYVPAVVVIDENDDIKLTISPEEISNGKLVEKIKSFQAQFLKDCEGELCPVPEKNLIDDFRSRKAVHEDFNQAGFIEDSEQFWRNRKGKEEEPQKPEDKKEQEEKEEIESTRLINRITDNLVSKLGMRIDSTVDKTTQKFMGKIDDVSGAIVGTVDKRISTEVSNAKKTAHRIALKAILVTCIFFLLLSWFSSMIKALVKKMVLSIHNKIYSKLKEIVTNAESKRNPKTNP